MNVSSSAGHQISFLKSATCATSVKWKNDQLICYTKSLVKKNVFCLVLFTVIGAVIDRHRESVLPPTPPEQCFTNLDCPQRFYCTKYLVFQGERPDLISQKHPGRCVCDALQGFVGQECSKFDEATSFYRMASFWCCFALYFDALRMLIKRLNVFFRPKKLRSELNRARWMVTLTVTICLLLIYQAVLSGLSSAWHTAALMSRCRTMIWLGPIAVLSFMMIPKMLYFHLSTWWKAGTILISPRRTHSSIMLCLFVLCVAFTVCAWIFDVFLHRGVDFGYYPTGDGILQLSLPKTLCGLWAICLFVAVGAKLYVHALRVGLDGQSYNRHLYSKGAKMPLSHASDLSLRVIESHVQMNCRWTRILATVFIFSSAASSVCILLVLKMLPSTPQALRTGNLVWSNLNRVLFALNLRFLAKYLCVAPPDIYKYLARGLASSDKRHSHERVYAVRSTSSKARSNLGDASRPSEPESKQEPLTLAPPAESVPPAGWSLTQVAGSQAWVQGQSRNRILSGPGDARPSSSHPGNDPSAPSRPPTARSSQKHFFPQNPFRLSSRSRPSAAATLSRSRAQARQASGTSKLDPALSGLGRLLTGPPEQEVTPRKDSKVSELWDWGDGVPPRIDSKVPGLWDWGDGGLQTCPAQLWEQGARRRCSTFSLGAMPVGYSSLGATSEGHGDSSVVGAPPEDSGSCLVALVRAGPGLGGRRERCRATSGGVGVCSLPGATAERGRSGASSSVTLPAEDSGSGRLPLPRPPPGAGAGTRARRGRCRAESGAATAAAAC